MRITESQLRKIVRQEVRRLSEVAPGVMAPRQPDMSAIQLQAALLDVDLGEVKPLAIEDHIGKAVGGLEELTDGSHLAVIVGFEHDPRRGTCAVLETDHGVITVCAADL